MHSKVLQIGKIKIIGQTLKNNWDTFPHHYGCCATCQPTHYPVEASITISSEIPSLLTYNVCFSLPNPTINYILTMLVLCSPILVQLTGFYIIQITRINTQFYRTIDLNEFQSIVHTQMQSIIRLPLKHLSVLYSIVKRHILRKKKK